MATSSSSLEKRIEAGFASLGIVTTGEHAFAHIISKVVAEAVVAEIKGNAEVVVTKGSSAGTYKVS